MRRRRRFALTLVLTLAVAAVAACGGDGGGGGGGPQGSSPAPPTNGPSGPGGGAVRRSQPYWTTVVELRGTGPATAAPFTLDPAALQWRMTFRCEAGAFSAAGAKGAEPLRRALATNARCGDGEGQAYSGEIGTITLTIAAGGPWDATIEQQVDGPLVEPLPAALASAQVVATGEFTGFDREGEGAVRVYRLADGSQAVRLENFYTSLNPDLGLLFTSLASFRTSAEVGDAPSVEVALLKATLGSMSFAVPAGVDVTTYPAVVIWSERARSAFAYAPLRSP